MNKDTTISAAVLEKITFMAESQIGAALAAEFALEPRVKVYVDGWLNNLAINISQSMLSQKLDEISVSYPADWWQAVKERFAPKWFLSRRPVKYERTVIDVRAVYPRMALPSETHFPIARILESGTAIIEGVQ